jgi:hypothetical protein
VDANTHNKIFLKKLRLSGWTLIVLHNFHPHPRVLLFPHPDSFHPHPRALLFPQNSKSKPLDLSPLSRLMFPLFPTISQTLTVLVSLSPSHLFIFPLLPLPLTVSLTSAQRFRPLAIKNRPCSPSVACLSLTPAKAFRPPAKNGFVIWVESVLAGLI